MTGNCFNRLVLGSPRRLALPIATYPGLALTGATVRQAVNDSEVVLCGNLDPTSVFCQLGLAEVRERTLGLLSQTAAHRNYVISSGCDVPAAAPLANLDVFYAAVKGY